MMIGAGEYRNGCSMENEDKGCACGRRALSVGVGTSEQPPSCVRWGVRRDCLRSLSNRTCSLEWATGSPYSPSVRWRRKVPVCCVRPRRRRCPRVGGGRGRNRERIWPGTPCGETDLADPAHRSSGAPHGATLFCARVDWSRLLLPQVACFFETTHVLATAR